MIKPDGGQVNQRAGFIARLEVGQIRAVQGTLVHKPRDPAVKSYGKGVVNLAVFCQRQAKHHQHALAFLRDGASCFAAGAQHARMGQEVPGVAAKAQRGQQQHLGARGPGLCHARQDRPRIPGDIKRRAISRRPGHHLDGLCQTVPPCCSGWVYGPYALSIINPWRSDGKPCGILKPSRQFLRGGYHAVGHYGRNL